MSITTQPAAAAFGAWIAVASLPIAKMQGEAVPFEMMLYPGYTHRVGGPKISVHLWDTIFGFLDRHGVTPPE